MSGEFTPITDPVGSIINSFPLFAGSNPNDYFSDFNAALWGIGGSAAVNGLGTDLGAIMATGGLFGGFNQGTYPATAPYTLIDHLNSPGFIVGEEFMPELFLGF